MITCNDQCWDHLRIFQISGDSLWVDHGDVCLGWATFIRSDAGVTPRTSGVDIFDCQVVPFLSLVQRFSVACQNIKENIETKLIFTFLQSSFPTCKIGAILRSVTVFDNTDDSVVQKFFLAIFVVDLEFVVIPLVRTFEDAEVLNFRLTQLHLEWPDIGIFVPRFHSNLTRSGFKFTKSGHSYSLYRVISDKIWSSWGRSVDCGCRSHRSRVVGDYNPRSNPLNL